MSQVQTDFSGALTKAIKPLIAIIAIAVILLIILAGYGFQASRQNASDDAAIGQAQALANKVIAVQSAERDLFAASQDARDEPKKTYDTASTDLQTAFDAFRPLLIQYSGQQKASELEASMGRWTEERQHAIQSFADPAGRPTAASIIPNQILGGLADMTATVADERAHRSGPASTIDIALALLIGIILVAAAKRLTDTKDNLIAAQQHDAADQDQVQAMRRQKALLATMLKSIGDAMVAVDTAGRITFMNAVAEKLTGWMEADAVGKDVGTVISVINEKTGTALPSPFARTLKDNIDQEINANAVLVGRDGVNRPITGQCAPVWEGKQSVIGAALIFRDVTEKRIARQELKTTEAYKEAILDAALDAVILMDASGRIIEFNKAAEQTLGYTRHEAMGASVVSVIIPPDQRNTFETGLTQYLAAGASDLFGRQIDTKAMRKGGGQIPVEMAMTAIPDVKPPVFAIFISDISVRKAAEDALLRAKEDAEEESRSKSMFLNDMSDELRTPLNAVIGYSEMLQEEANARNVDGFVPDLQKIHSAGKLLLTFVTDVLDLSKIEAGKMELFVDEFDVQDVVEEIVASVKPLVDGNQNTLDVRVPANIGMMRGDRTKVRQSVLYLISNAARFAQERSLVLDVKREKGKIGDTITFRIADTTPGLPPEQAQKLAAAFAASGAGRTYRFGGHGLGLAIAQQLCEMMSGELVVTREVGHSPEFLVKLPAKAA